MSMEWFDAVSISKVYNRLYVGGYVQATGLAVSNPFGIQAVLDVSTEEPYDEAKDIVYAHVPFPDGGAVPQEKFWECMRFLAEHYQKGDTILIHCAAGISRSVSIAISFLCYAHIMDFDDAFTEVCKRRGIANPHRSILNSCRMYLKIWPYDGSME